MLSCLPGTPLPCSSSLPVTSSFHPHQPVLTFNPRRPCTLHTLANVNPFRTTLPDFSMPYFRVLATHVLGAVLFLFHSLSFFVSREGLEGVWAMTSTPSPRAPEVLVAAWVGVGPRPPLLFCKFPAAERTQWASSCLPARHRACPPSSFTSTSPSLSATWGTTWSATRSVRLCSLSYFSFFFTLVPCKMANADFFAQFRC